MVQVFYNNWFLHQILRFSPRSRCRPGPSFHRGWWGWRPGGGSSGYQGRSASRSPSWDPASDQVKHCHHWRAESPWVGRRGAECAPAVSGHRGVELTCKLGRCRFHQSEVFLNSQRTIQRSFRWGRRQLRYSEWSFLDFQQTSFLPCTPSSDSRFYVWK